MEVLKINEIEGKGIKEAQELLYKNGFSTSKHDTFKLFCEEEATFRVTELNTLSIEEKMFFNSLSKEKQLELLHPIYTRYFEDDGVFNYDYMDEIIHEEFKLFLDDNKDLLEELKKRKEAIEKILIEEINANIIKLEEIGVDLVYDFSSDYRITEFYKYTDNLYDSFTYKRN